MGSFRPHLPRLCEHSLHEGRLGIFQGRNQSIISGKSGNTGIGRRSIPTGLCHRDDLARQQNGASLVPKAVRRDGTSPGLHRLH